MNTQDYLNKLKKKFQYKQVVSMINKCSNIKALVIGDTIIDQYVFVLPKGRAIKDPILSVEYKHHQTFAGGVLAIANHVSNFAGTVKVVTLVGDRKGKTDFIKKNLNKKVDLKSFTKDNSPTTVKKRYVDISRNNKMFKVEYINDKPIDEKLSKKIISYLDKEIPKYDIVLVGDFGHGFINEQIRRKLEEKSNFLALNVQSNSANMGYNYPNLYKKFDFITMNEHELRLPISKRFEAITDTITEAKSSLGYDNFLVTEGKSGCIYVSDDKIIKAPALVQNVTDTVGAGDALFALASLFASLKADKEIIPFIANCAGGIASNIVGNERAVDKDILMNFIKERL